MLWQARQWLYPILHNLKLGVLPFLPILLYLTLMADWIRIADARDCPPGKAVECVVEGRIVALFNVDGTFHAIDGVCPHQGGPLAKGRLDGAIVTCPWHGWQFDVATGQHRAAKAVAQRCFSVRVEGGEVLIDMESGS